MEYRHTQAGDAEPGPVAGFGALVKKAVGLLLNRVELAALELGEARDSLIRLLLIGALGMVALLFALGCWTALVVVLAWESMGWKILLAVAVLYTLLAAFMLRHARALLAQDKLSLPATLTELRKDRDALL